MVKPNKRLDPDPRVWDFKTEYQLGQDNIRPLGLDIHNPFFMISSIVIAGFVLLALANQEASAVFFGWLRPWLTSTFDWFLVLSGTDCFACRFSPDRGQGGKAGLFLCWLDCVDVCGGHWHRAVVFWCA